MQFTKWFCFVLILGLASCQTAEKETAEKPAAKTEVKTQKPAESQRVAAQKSPADQLAADKQLIQNYVTNNGLKGQFTDSGIFYTIEKDGSGANPSINSQVTCHYKGTLLSGKQFDSSYDRGQPATFALTRVIKGWQEGIPLLKKGGKGKFIIPSGLAYGAQNRGPSLPANSVLIFDVELIDIK